MPRSAPEAEKTRFAVQDLDKLIEAVVGKRRVFMNTLPRPSSYIFPSDVYFFS